MDKNLNEILESYCKDYYEKKDLPFVVKKSIPIAWFGDINAYLNSDKKILTVALNPSDKEFIENRFPKALESLNAQNLYDSLNAYFEENPYSPWFKNFEKILNILDSTYGGKLNTNNKTFKNQSISIDIYSPLATSPTWGKLKSSEKQAIINTSLFKTLLDYLNPDIILISVSQNDMIENLQLENIIPVDATYKKGIKISGYKTDTRIVLYGRNYYRTPFGGMTDDWKKECISQIIANLS